MLSELARQDQPDRSLNLTNELQHADDLMKATSRLESVPLFEYLHNFAASETI